jgi:quercetin dioxygenase-like cupin family protein
MKSGKVWGETWEIFSRNGVRCMGLHINSGAYCSKHKHRHQANHFHVLYGYLRIKVWKKDYPLCDETILCSGDSMIVLPDELHQFEAITDTMAIETYWGECDERDIERDSCGGSA